MSAADLTAFVSTGVSLLGVFLGWRLSKRKKQNDTDMADVVSWRSMNEALQQEINRLTRRLADSERDYQKQLDDMGATHREQIKNLNQDWESRMANSQTRVTGLESQVGVLREELTKAIRGGGAL